MGQLVLVLQDLVHQGVLNKMTDRTPIEFVIDALETTLIIHPDERLLHGNYMNYGPVENIISSLGPLMRGLDLKSFKTYNSRINDLLWRYE